MHTITVSLNPRSVEKAIKELADYKRKLNDKLNNAMRKIATDIAARILEIYAEQPIDPHLPEEWNELPTAEAVELPSGNGYEVVINGKQVGFLEFGAGAYAGAGESYKNEVTFPVYPGSYSETLGSGSYMRWVMYHGTDQDYIFNRIPARAIYRAVQEMKPLITEYVRKELEKW